jgi:Putative prokaryotic signal transducing protein
MAPAIAQDEKTMKSDECVVVKTFTGEMPASIAASRLESEGIEVHMHKDDCGGAYPQLQMSGGVRLLVRPEDLENAKRILSEIGSGTLSRAEEEASYEVEDELPPEAPGPTNSNFIVSIGLFVVGVMVGYFVAPRPPHRSPYTGVLKYEKNAAGVPGVFRYYDHDKLVRVEEDRNYDGKIDIWRKYVAGKWSSTAFDDNFDGKPDKWIICKGRWSWVERIDTDFDGTPDVTIYVVNDMFQREDWHPKGSKIIERREVYKNGLLKEILTDTNHDGVFNLKTTYDPYKRPIETTKCRIKQ